MFRGPSIRRLKRRVLLALWMLATAARALADNPPVPPAPADGLYDDASVLSEAQRASAVKAVAMARAAGEVAPLMIVGMVKLAPTLPVDLTAPFVHFERKFMHLGFHIYDVGFQSPNVDATKPLVFATALLLILVVTAMNLVAISIRNRLRRKYAGSAV